MELDVVAHVPAEALVDRNVFRRKRLYKENVDGLLRRHVASLQVRVHFSPYDIPPSNFGPGTNKAMRFMRRIAMDTEKGG